MASIITNIEHFFRQKSVLSNLIAINILVFLLIKITGIFFMLFNSDINFILHYIELPAELQQLFIRPWTLISYMFTHTGFFHILFNLLWLYWFGKIFLLFFGHRQLGGLYILGGMAGGILYIAAYNIFPYFLNNVSNSYLIGASASVMAIVFAASFYKKDFEIGLLFLGNIKIFYLAIISLIIDLISIQTTNSGGHIAHIGGALMGIWFAESYKRGKDLTGWINVLIDKFANLFKKRPKQMKVKYKKAETDQEYNARKHTENVTIDRILEKIKRSGYDSLTEEEKKKLFDASKK